MKQAKVQLIQSILTGARFWGHRIATAESCTGGMVAAALTKIAGASDVFDSGFVTYSSSAKIRLLGVSVELIDQFGAVSQPVAIAMATGALARSDATIAVAVTGIAGPGGSQFKPEGRVCFARAQTGQPTFAQTIEYGALGRDQVRQSARDHALRLLAEKLAI